MGLIRLPDAPTDEALSPVGWIGPQTSRPISEVEGGQDYLDLSNKNLSSRRGLFEEATDPELGDFAFGDYLAIAEPFRIAKTARKLYNDEDVSDEELVEMNRYMAYDQRKRLQSKSADVLDIAQTSLAFGSEIALTSIAVGLLMASGIGIPAGIGLAVGATAAASARKAAKVAGTKAATLATRKLIQKLATRATGKALIGRKVGRMAEKAITAGLSAHFMHTAAAETMGAATAKMSKGVLSKFMGRKAGTKAARYLGNINKVAADLESRALINQLAHPERTVRAIAERRLSNALSNGDESVAASIAKGILDMNIEYASEFSGIYLGAAAKRLLPKRLISRMGASRITSWMIKDKGSKNAQAMWNALEVMGVDGTVSEMGEERAGDFMRGLFGVHSDAGLKSAVKGLFPGLEQLSTEAAAFAILPMTANSLNRVSGGSSFAEMMETKKMLGYTEPTPGVRAKERPAIREEAVEIDAALDQESAPWYKDSIFSFLGDIFGETRRGHIQSVLARKHQANLREVRDEVVSEEEVVTDLIEESKENRHVENLTEAKARKKYRTASAQERRIMKRKARDNGAQPFNPEAGVDIITDFLEASQRVVTTGIKTKADADMFNLGVKEGHIVETHFNDRQGYLFSKEIMTDKGLSELRQKTGIAMQVPIADKEKFAEIAHYNSAEWGKTWNQLSKEQRDEFSDRWHSSNESWLKSRYNFIRKIVNTGELEGIDLYETLPVVYTGTAKEILEASDYVVQPEADVYEVNDDKENVYAFISEAVTNQAGDAVHIATNARRWAFSEDIVEAKIKKWNGGNLSLPAEANAWFKELEDKLNVKTLKGLSATEKIQKQMLSTPRGRFELFVKSFLLNRMGYKNSSFNDKYARIFEELDMPVSIDVAMTDIVGDKLMKVLAFEDMQESEIGEKHQRVKDIVEKGEGSVKEARELVDQAQKDELITKLADALKENYSYNVNKDKVADVLKEMDKAEVTFSLTIVGGKRAVTERERETYRQMVIDMQRHKEAHGKADYTTGQLKIIEKDVLHALHKEAELDVEPTDKDSDEEIKGIHEAAEFQILKTAVESGTLADIRRVSRFLALAEETASTPTGAEGDRTVRLSKKERDDIADDFEKYGTPEDARRLSVAMKNYKAKVEQEQRIEEQRIKLPITHPGILVPEAVRIGKMLESYRGQGGKATLLESTPQGSGFVKQNGKIEFVETIPKGVEAIRDRVVGRFETKDSGPVTITTTLADAEKRGLFKVGFEEKEMPIEEKLVRIRHDVLERGIEATTVGKAARAVNPGGAEFRDERGGSVRAESEQNNDTSPEFTDPVFSDDFKKPLRTRYDDTGKAVYMPKGFPRQNQNVPAVAASSGAPFSVSSSNARYNLSQQPGSTREDLNAIFGEAMDNADWAEDRKQRSQEQEALRKVQGRSPKEAYKMRELHRGRSLGTEVETVTVIGMHGGKGMIPMLGEMFPKAEIRDRSVLPKDTTIPQLNKWVSQQTRIGHNDINARINEEIFSEKANVDGWIVIIDWDLEERLAFPATRAIHAARTGQLINGDTSQRWQFRRTGEGQYEIMEIINSDDILSQIDQPIGDLQWTLPTDFFRPFKEVSEFVPEPSEFTKFMHRSMGTSPETSGPSTELIPDAFQAAVFPIANRKTLQRIQKMTGKPKYAARDTLATQIHDWMRRNKIRNLGIIGMDSTEAKESITFDIKKPVPAEYDISPEFNKDLGVLPMKYTMPAEAVREGLKDEYPDGTTTKQLVEDGVRTGTTRKPFGKVGNTFRVGNTKYRITSVKPIDLTSDEGRLDWEASEGWDAGYAEKKFPKLVFDGAIQTQFTPAKQGDTSPMSVVGNEITYEDKAVVRGSWVAPLGSVLGMAASPAMLKKARSRSAAEQQAEEPVNLTPEQIEDIEQRKEADAKDLQEQMMGDKRGMLRKRPTVVPAPVVPVAPVTAVAPVEDRPLFGSDVSSLVEARQARRTQIAEKRVSDARDRFAPADENLAILRDFAKDIRRPEASDPLYDEIITAIPQSRLRTNGSLFWGDVMDEAKRVGLIPETETSVEALGPLLSGRQKTVGEVVKEEREFYEGQERQETHSLTPNMNTYEGRIFEAIRRGNNNRVFSNAEAINYTGMIDRAVAGNDAAKRQIARNMTTVDRDAFKGLLGEARAETEAVPIAGSQVGQDIVPPAQSDFFEGLRTQSMTSMDSLFDSAGSAYTAGAAGLHKMILAQRAHLRAVNFEEQAFIDTVTKELGIDKKRPDLPEDHREQANSVLDAVGAILDTPKEKIARIPLSVASNGDVSSMEASVLAEQWDAYIRDNNIDMDTTQKLVDKIRARYDLARTKANKFMDTFSDKEWIRYYDDYINHEYEYTTKEQRDEIVRKMREDAKQSKERRIPTYYDAAVKHGILPQTMNALDLYKRWNQVVWNAARIKGSTSVGVTIADLDGGPVLIPVRNSEAIKGADQLIPDAALQSNSRNLANYLGQKYNPTADPQTEINRMVGEMDVAENDYVKLDSPYTDSIDHFLVRKGAAEKLLKNVLNSGLMTNRFVNAIEHLNAWSKFSMLGMSMFHPFALLESLSAVHGIGLEKKGWNEKVKAFAANPAFHWKKTKNEMVKRLEDMREHPEKYTDWLEAELMVDIGNPDVKLGLIERDIEEVLKRAKDPNSLVPKAAAKPLNAVKKYKSAVDKYLWHNFHPAVKMYSAEFVMNEWLAQNPEADEYEVKEVRKQIAGYINDAFGGQNWDLYTWATPRVRQMLHLLAFAPDWSLSAANISGLTRLPGLDNLHIGNLSPLAKDNMMRRYWPAMTAIVLFGLPNMMQALIYAVAGDPDEGDKPFTFMNEAGKKTHIDFTPIFRKLPHTGDAQEQRRMYMRWGKQAYEISEGWLSDRNMVLRKSSSVVRAAFEAVTGSTVSGWALPWKDEGLLGLIQADGQFSKGWLAAQGRKFLPISITSLVEGKPASFIAPMSKGVSQGGVIWSMKTALESYLDRSVLPKELHPIAPELIASELIDAAVRNGIDPVISLRRAKAAVLGGHYRAFFEALNDNDDSALEEEAIKIMKLGKGVDDFHKAMKRRYEPYDKEYTDELSQAVKDAYGKASEQI